MRDLPYLARTDNEVSSSSGLLWRRAIQTERWLVYSAKVARCCFFEDCNWFNWEENGILCPNSKHLWGDQTGRCYTWSIKKPKLSKMNSTCSMKAWHRCVSLWGPPGRLCTASWVVETGFKSVFFPLHSYCKNKLVGCTYAFCKTIRTPRACWQHFYLCLFEGERIHGRDIGPNSASRW